jgi:Icc-related predicted phosphoesterase
MSKLRLFFVTDVHGSERCFIKFVNAGKFYKANALVLGGDITGKLVVPIVEKEGTYVCEVMSSQQVARTKEELAKLEKLIRDLGYYPYHTSPSEVETLRSSPEKLDQLFSRLMRESVEKWMSLAEERLGATNIECYVSPGNDDRFEIDEIISKSSYVKNPEGQRVKLGGSHEMITTGFTNMTPWKCPRDVPEAELAKKVEALTSMVENFETCIFNFHCPPYNSGLDMAPKLDEKLTPVLGPGAAPTMIPVGSPSVRTAIEEFQPLIGLHGHVHESRGTVKIGKTLCINPGSEYSEGILRGALIDIEGNKIDDFMLTAG